MASLSLISKCGNTLFCYLRTIHLWLIVIVVFLFGVAHRRLRSGSSKNQNSKEAVLRSKTSS
jgi:hypothetical protein